VTAERAAVLLGFFVESPGRGADVTGRVPLPPVLVGARNAAHTR
jgi:hypothetical protein